MQDTFFIEQSGLMSQRTPPSLTHIQTTRAASWSTTGPPIRVICLGRVYRNEAISARAHCFFHQLEGLYVDKNVSFTDLKQVLLTFARELFGPTQRSVCVRSYFPSQSQALRWDISCHICGGKGCGFCKHTGWVEILGCGTWWTRTSSRLCGIDSKVYTGYAVSASSVSPTWKCIVWLTTPHVLVENDTRFLALQVCVSRIRHIILRQYIHPTLKVKTIIFRKLYCKISKGKTPGNPVKLFLLFFY